MASDRRRMLKFGRLMRSQRRRGLTSVVERRGVGPHPDTGVIGEYVELTFDTRRPYPARGSDGR